MSRWALVAVARGSTVRGSALLVAFRLADHADDQTGWAWPSVRLLSEETGLHPETVGTAIRALEDAGELHVERGIGRRRNRYRLRLPGVPGSAPHEAPDVAVVRGSAAHPARCLCADCPPVVRGSPPRSARMSRADPYRTSEPADAAAFEVLEPVPPAPIPAEERAAAPGRIEEARQALRAKAQTRTEFEAELLAEYPGVIERQRARGGP